MTPEPSTPATPAPATPPSWVAKGALLCRCDEKRFLTLLLVVTTVVMLLAGWFYGFLHPSTDDAYVYANVVGVAPQIEGPVTRVHVRDNQRVALGEPLLEIDPRPFRARFDQANADVERTEAAAEKARLHYNRIAVMAESNFVSQDDFDTAKAAKDQTAAEAAAARANLEYASLNLGYTRITAPVNGLATNVTLSPGTYLKPGEPAIALIDSDSWHVIAYFREGSVRHIRPGMAADVQLTMYPGYTYHGRVEGVGWGVFQIDGSTGKELLPDIRPTVDWIRLAARFPVRINLKGFPEDRPLRSGARAVVKIYPRDAEEKEEP